MKRNIHNTGNEPRTNPNTEGGATRAAAQTMGAVWAILLKALKTFIFVGGISGCIVLFSVISIILSYKDAAIPNLDALELDLSSTVYVTDENAPTGYSEYMIFHSTENREWVDYKDLPEDMINAMTAIEDKRFWEHDGVDWYTTLGSVYRLATGGSGGGSTITQQLIKNVTGENDVSITRKVKEIFTALNLEKEYSKEEILQAYLNYVNFGSGCCGVQAAAKLYFDKDIWDCSIAECAAIAGITQNPSRWSPLIYPDNNKIRREIVIEEMYNQELITYAEYQKAMKESATMTFVGYKDDDDDVTTGSAVWNWYTELMFDDLLLDLQGLGYSEDMASDLIYSGGLHIYSAMDPVLQEAIENLVINEYELDEPGIQAGMFLMDYNGRVMAVVGSLDEKTGNRWFNYATDAKRQPGSTFKAVSAYGAAMSLGKLNYSTLLKDEPVENYFGVGSPGPNNWMGKFFEHMTVAEAIGISQNAPAAQVVNEITPQYCYDFLTTKLGFTSLEYDTDRNWIGAMSIGGLEKGVTVREMTAAFAVFGSGGVYNKPYTYDYVTDSEGNVILDNRDKTGTQALTLNQATIMNKLLHEPIYGGKYEKISEYSATGSGVSFSGTYDIYGKTGTTDHDHDSWFIGGTPYAVAGVWTGYEDSENLDSTWDAKGIWRAVMQYLYDTYDTSEASYVLSSNIYRYEFCLQSGKLAEDHCKHTHTGWFDPNDLPDPCKKDDHWDESSSSSEESSDTSSETSGENSSDVSMPSPSPTPTPETTPTPEATPTPTPVPTPTPEPPVSSKEPVSSEEETSSEDPVSSEEVTSNNAAG